MTPEELATLRATFKRLIDALEAATDEQILVARRAEAAEARVRELEEAFGDLLGEIWPREWLHELEKDCRVEAMMPSHVVMEAYAALASDPPATEVEK